MSLMQNTVLLLKSEKTENPDKYEELLRSHNFEVMSVKTLVFEYKNINKLTEKLHDPDSFSGLIFSSPRCVNATSQTLPKTKISDLWGHKHNFAVGETTQREALEKLGLSCAGQESGNAKNLAQVIIKDKAKFTKPFLFPHGNLKTDTLQLELGKENLSIEGVLVYETSANPDIEGGLRKSTKGFTAAPEFIVFFSPSGLHSAIHHLRKTPIDLAKIIAIGPVTELAIQEENLKVFSVARNPTPEDILDAIKGN